MELSALAKNMIGKSKTIVRNFNVNEDSELDFGTRSNLRDIRSDLLFNFQKLNRERKTPISVENMLFVLAL